MGGQVMPGDGGWGEVTERVGVGREGGNHTMDTGVF